MDRSSQPICLAGSQLGAVRHVCAFFANDDEEYRVLLPFIREGLACGDKVVQVINPDAGHQHLERMAGAGIDAAAHVQTGQLRIRNNTDVYLKDGRFDAERMLASFEEMASSARNAEGFPLSRIVCRMDWVGGDPSRVEDVIEFESRVNDVWSRYDDAVVCTYHLANLRGDAIIDIMRTHPMVIIGGTLQQNPFYTPPEEFLREYRGQRRARAS